MPTPFNGVADNPSRPAAVNIASSTNATPIVVTTSGAHSLTEGDEIQVAGHATNTAANGVWYAHIVSSTQVSLLVPVTRANSTGNGVGGATGTVQSQNLSPTYNEPSDGDAGSAASVNVALSALGDRTAWLAQRMGSHKLLASTVVGPVDTLEPPGTMVTWSSNAYASPTSVATLTANLVAGDIVVVRGMLCVQTTGGDNFFVKAQRNNGSGVSDFTGQARLFISANIANTFTNNHAITCAETIAANASITSWSLVLTGRSVLSTSFSALNNSIFEIIALRPN